MMGGESQHRSKPLLDIMILLRQKDLWDQNDAKMSVSSPTSSVMFPYSDVLLYVLGSFKLNKVMNEIRM